MEDIIKEIVEIMKYILESNIINFCLMVWLLVFVCKKMNIKSAFDKSIKSVENYIDKSKLERQNSDKLVKESEKLIKKLPQDIENIEKFNKQKTEIFKKQLSDNAQKSIEKIANEIEALKTIEEKIVSNSMLEYSFNKSIEKVEGDIIEKLKLEPDLHYKFIDKSLDELDRITL